MNHRHMYRRFQKEGYPEAYKHAVEECIRRGILADYLKKKGSEVVNMLTAEYDYDLDIEVQREEAFADGVDKGKEELLTEQIIKKLAKGKTPVEIADALEKPLETVQEIVDKIKENSGTE